LAACVFCGIVAGTVEASVVREDDATLAFMDLRQSNPGHVLVIPKRHVEMVYDLDPETAARLFQAAVTLARALRRSLDPRGLNLWQSNGDAAGQEVPHVHLHLLPRYPGDGLLRIYSDRPAQPSREELDGLAVLIRAGLIDAD
jgi:histidine triad (HIT) family protein